MFFAALGVAVLIALVSLVGALFFGDSRRLIGFQRYVVPIAVGVFLSLILFELIPETLELSPNYGMFSVALGFIAFYILANILHKKYHDYEDEDCDKKGAALLLLIGDAIHNMADGLILGSAFLLDPAVGVAVAIGLALHEIPQEIVEFGVLVRAGYTRMKAVLLNLLSASSIIIGTLVIFVVAEQGSEYVWILTGIAAGNLLFLATSELLPRIHGNLEHYGNIWRSATSITLGFVIMTSILVWTDEHFGHGHEEHQDETELFEGVA